MKTINKTSNVGSLGGLAISIVVLAVILAVGFTMLEKLQTAVTANGAAYNATADISTAMETIVDFVPVIIIASVGALVIGLFAYNYMRQ